MGNILEVKNLTFNYDEYDTKTGLSVEGKNGIRNISFSIPAGSFVTLCGSTGSGKSTLLKLLKKDVITAGKQTGEIIFDGKNINDIPEAGLTSSIGLLFQNPEDQIVTDKVWHEIAFGLENIGLSGNEAQTRLAEVLAFFRLENISRCDTATLSGGQKQLVSLAGVLAMYPRLLLLDEPTSQLDPEAAEHYISTIKKLQSTLGITVIIAEHNLDRLLPISDILMVMDKGCLVSAGPTKDTLLRLAGSPDSALRADLPLPARFGINVGTENIPLDISQGRQLLKDIHKTNRTISDNISSASPKNDSAPLLKLKNITFRYSASGVDVLYDLCAEFMSGRIYSILGCNASGKSTLLNLIAGNIRPQLGNLSPRPNKIKTAYMPQDTDNLFIAETVEKELLQVGLKPENYPDYIRHLDYSHSPLDLSGGEKQLLGLAKVSALKPSLLLLDEPTKGTDNISRSKMAEALKALRKSGTTIIMASHDMTFAAECADYCSILSMGNLAEMKTARNFFISNQLYTTPARSMSKGIIDNIYLESDLFSL